MGLAFAYRDLEKLNTTVAILTILCCLLMQIGTNLVNDYFDYAKGVDTHDRLGPTRVTQAGILAPAQVKRGYQIVFGGAFLLGIPLMMTGGPVIVIIGLASLLAAYAYTGGPLPLSYLGLGEVLALVFFGPVAVFGTYYLQTHFLNLEVVLYGLIPGFLSWSILAVNNLRDIDGDRINGKKSLAVRVGLMGARLIVIFGIMMAQVLNLNAYFLHHNKIAPLSLIITILFFKVWRTVLIDPISSKLNNTLAAIGKFLFINCLIFSLGLVL